MFFRENMTIWYEGHAGDDVYGHSLRFVSFLQSTCTYVVRPSHLWRAEPVKHVNEVWWNSTGVQIAWKINIKSEDWICTFNDTYYRKHHQHITKNINIHKYMFEEMLISGDVCSLVTHVMCGEKQSRANHHLFNHLSINQSIIQPSYWMGWFHSFHIPSQGVLRFGQPPPRPASSVYLNPFSVPSHSLWYVFFAFSVHINFHMNIIYETNIKKHGKAYNILLVVCTNLFIFFAYYISI